MSAARADGMVIDVTFPGGKRVDASFGGFVIRTDQSTEHGGDGSAPEPFATFLAALGACAGLYVLAFCQARGLATDGLRLVERSENDTEGRLARVTLEIQLPPGFPEKYRDAVARAASACKIKKTLERPPEVDVVAK